MDNKFKSIFGEMTEERKQAMNEAKIKHEEMLERKEKSYFHCRIPDWTGQGGMVDFWINENGKFESEDSRIQDKEIREGIQKFARDWA